jgi:hypothetical protein
MTRGSKTGCNRVVLGWALAGFLLFVAGFLLLHGREALASGSWLYVITQADEYAFWVIADSFADDPISDGNPFYFEQTGQRNPLLAYPTVAAVGYLAAVVGVPAIYLLPLWKIVAPFLTWIVLTWCLVRFWGVSRASAAAVSMLVLVIPQYVHGPAQYSLLRFSRPLDAVGLVAIWLSVAFHPQHSGRWYVPVVGGSSFLIFFLSPFYGVFGVWVLCAGGILSGVTGRILPSLKLFLMGLVGAGAGTILLVFVYYSRSESPWLQDTLQYGTDLSNLYVLWPLPLIGLGLVAVLCVSRRKWTRIDVVLGAVLSIDLFVAHDLLLTGQDLQLAEHRYYYQTFQMFAIIGWLWQSLPWLSPGEQRRRWEPVVISCILVLQGIILVTPDFNYLRTLPRSIASDDAFDNALLLLELLPLCVVLLWVLRRTHVGRYLARPVVAAPLIATFVLVGFATQPSALRTYNESVAARGPHEYLAQHASAGEVLLSVPWNYLLVDYAPLYSPVKVFYSHYGQRYAPPGSSRDYRQNLFVALLSGRLNETGNPMEGSLETKLNELRLDYVLANKTPPRDVVWQRIAPDWVRETGTMADLAQSQLGGHLVVAYEDEDFVLWRVQTGQAD